MVNTIYQKSFAALMKRPFRLWGISLLGALLCWLAGIGFAGILAVGFAIAWAIDVSLAMIFLHTYQTGEEPHTADLFQTFRKDRFLRRGRRHGMDEPLDFPLVADPGRGHRVRRDPDV